MPPECSIYGCDQPPSPGERPKLCAYHTLRHDDGRGLCIVEGCRNVRTRPFAGGLCVDHTVRAKPSMAPSDKRVLSAVAKGVDPVEAVAREKGIENKAKASQALDRMYKRPAFREGLEAILTENGEDPNDDIRQLWRSIIEGSTSAMKNVVIDGQIEELGPDWQARAAMAALAIKATVGNATTKQEISASTSNVTIQVPGREPLPDNAAIVEAIVEEDEEY